MKIQKVVIPAAGFGTRFLPFTKAVPKEMLPLLNKPAIHHIIQEAVYSGIKSCILITAAGKEAIEHYFSYNPALASFLQEKEKTGLLNELNELIKQTAFTYVLQEKALGLGHAVSLAQPAIADEFFGVILPDDIMMGHEAALAQLITLAQQEQATVIAVQEVPREATTAYGIIGIKKQITDRLFEVNALIEKPKQSDAPSNLAIIGRYILSPSIFPALASIAPSVGGELQLTDGLSKMLNNGNKIFAYLVEGRRFDIGTPTGWIQANNYLFQQSSRH